MLAVAQGPVFRGETGSPVARLCALARVTRLALSRAHLSGAALMFCCVFGPAPLPASQDATARSAPVQSASVPATAALPRLLSASSGPSGKAVGERFVLDEERHRFLIPQDKAVIVYMEFEGLPGEHRISGIWKRPDGATAFVSPDIVMVSDIPRFNAYWTFRLNPSMPPGMWRLEALVDGVPVGGYPFEVVAPSEASSTVMEAGVSARIPSLEDLYALRTSLVWVHRLDAQGRRLGVSSGFVVMENLIATSFQAIDAADAIEVEFSNGRLEPVSQVAAYSAEDDWALLQSRTDVLDALPTMTSGTVAVGERMVVFNAAPPATREIGGVDITGRRGPAQLERWVFNPGLSQSAMGGPLLDRSGHVAGLLSSCGGPGARGATGRDGGIIGIRLCTNNSAIPFATIATHFNDSPVPLAALRQSGVIASPVRESAAFLNGGTRRHQDAERSKRRRGQPIVDDRTEFAQADREVEVYSWWRWPENARNPAPIAASTQVLDMRNRIRAAGGPVQVKLSRKVPVESVFVFAITGLEPGIYRIDSLADGKCVWRTFIEVQP